MKNMMHEEVEIQTVTGILVMFDDHKVLVKSFPITGDRYQEEPEIEFFMRLLSEWTNDGRQYNIPTV